MRTLRYTTAAVTLLIMTSSAFAAAAPKPGPGVVWVNPDSKTYHCYGSQFYGNTKQGSYMTEGAAKKEGDSPAGNKACS